MLMQRLWHICGRVVRNHFAKKTSVPEGETTGSIDPYDILIILPHLHNDPSSVPFLWICAGLVLDSHCVTYIEGPELMRPSL